MGVPPKDMETILDTVAERFGLTLKPTAAQIEEKKTADTTAIIEAEKATAAAKVKSANEAKAKAKAKVTAEAADAKTMTGTDKTDGD